MNWDFKKGMFPLWLVKTMTKLGRCHLGMLLTPVAQPQSIATDQKAIKINQVLSHTKGVGIQGKQI